MMSYHPEKHKNFLLFLVWIVVLASCTEVVEPPDEQGESTITILYTNDEHGWFEESDYTDGAAKLLGIWKEIEGYAPDEPFLILSGGDNWTGPAISTWFQGESMVEIMNAMGYDAAAIGNHEFDFTVDGLNARIEQADFPYLSANIRFKGSSDIPPFAQPYTLIDVDGIWVGIIGLTTTSTPSSAFPTYVEDYDFIEYSQAIEEFAPQVWDAGADIVLLIAHICDSEMLDLAPVAREQGISMIGGGHCNQLIAEEDQGLALIQAGWQLAYYAKLDIRIDRDNMIILKLEPSIIENTNGYADEEISNLIQNWQQTITEELGEIIGYAASEIPRYSAQMHNLVTDSWLWAYPLANIAITNSGGIRQSIGAGEVTRETIVGVLPFDNNLVELHLTGEEVIDCLDDYMIVGGIYTTDGYRHSDGTLLKMDSLYTVLTTDYLYVQENTNFHFYDADPYYTGLNYHQPTMDYIISLNTSISNPLDDYLDYDYRR